MLIKWFKSLIPPAASEGIDMTEQNTKIIPPITYPLTNADKHYMLMMRCMVGVTNEGKLTIIKSRHHSLPKHMDDVDIDTAMEIIKENMNVAPHTEQAHNE